MPVVANIVLGKDGATTSNGNSAPLSSGADRERFHQLRMATDLIVIGGETSRREPYRQDPVPLAVMSRRELLSGTAAENPQAFLIRGGIGPALLELQSKYTSILLECGRDFSRKRSHSTLLITSTSPRRIPLVKDPTFYLKHPNTTSRLYQKRALGQEKNSSVIMRASQGCRSSENILSACPQ
jgi:hypothetical protein